MIKKFIKWGIGSFIGCLTLSELFFSIPLLLLGLVVNIRAGYPTADLDLLVVSLMLGGLFVACGLWSTRKIILRGREEN